VETYTRQELADIAAAQGDPLAAAVLDKALLHKAWQAKTEFSEEEFLVVLESITAQARTTLVARPGVPPTTKAHLAGLLSALQRHALPLAKRCANSAT
jgi:hypothetical protein